MLLNQSAASANTRQASYRSAEASCLLVRHLLRHGRKDSGGFGGTVQVFHRTPCRRLHLRRTKRTLHLTATFNVNSRAESLTGHHAFSHSSPLVNRQVTVQADDPSG